MFAFGKPVPVDQQDRMIIRSIRQAGADLSKPREITHYLTFTTEHGTLAVLKVLDRDDRFVHARIDPVHLDSEVTLKHTDVLTIELIRSLRRELEWAAQAFGGKYDGWEAAASP